MIKALPELDIARNISRLLDKTIQGVLLLEMRDHPVTYCLIKTSEIVTGDPCIGFDGVVSKLLDEHLKFGRIFVGTTLSPLFDGFRTFNDISLAVGCQVLFFEGLEEGFEQRERFDVFIGVNVPDFRHVAKPGSSETGLFVSGDLGKFHIFFHSEHP